MKGTRRKVFFGRLFRDIRDLAGLTQEELAPKLGITQGALSKIERSAMSPRAETFVQLVRSDYVGSGANSRIADRIFEFWETGE